jgi:GT2 family glycosyltransferase
MTPRPAVSVIVPFHRNLDHLRRCLSAVAGAAEPLPVDAVEIVVVADGSPVDASEVVRDAGGRLLSIEGPNGPAVARNRGAAQAHGDLLMFVDSDVVVHRDVLGRFLELFEHRRGLGAAFGAYDDAPADPGFFSQCRNLGHSFVHQRSSGEARTFWAGLGAVRAAAFSAVDGFDERFRRPSVEDIDLGYRLAAAGFPIVLDPAISGQHLKRWTFWSSIRTDVLDRGIPWTQLIERYGAMHDDLNLTVRYRACVVAAYLLVLALLGAAIWPALLAAAAVLLAALWWLDAPYYAFFARRRGWLFTLRWFPFHILHHLCNGVSFAAGIALRRVRRWTGLCVPGALPLDAWSRAEAAERREPSLAR